VYVEEEIRGQIWVFIYFCREALEPGREWDEMGSVEEGLVSKK
jgi:hypothetical protein